jgi:hypothetical protein
MRVARARPGGLGRLLEVEEQGGASEVERAMCGAEGELQVYLTPEHVFVWCAARRTEIDGARDFWLCGAQTRARACNAACGPGSRPSGDRFDSRIRFGDRRKPLGREPGNALASGGVTSVH